MNKADLIFKANIRRILKEGCLDENPRPRYESDGEPAHSQYISMVYEEYDLSKGELPLTTLRPIAVKNAIKEILWIFQDESNDLNLLEEKYGIFWWRKWEVGSTGKIGQRYGATIRRYQMMRRLLNDLREDPFGRRHIINMLQESDLRETDGLYPCAFQTMWTVRKFDGETYLDMTLTQRSSDYLVAGHVNCIQYVALQMMVAHELDMKVGKFGRFTQNLHIYSRHVEQAEELLNRPTAEGTPKLVLNAEGKSFYDITIDDFELIDYTPTKPQLKFELGI